MSAISATVRNIIAFRISLAANDDMVERSLSGFARARESAHAKA